MSVGDSILKTVVSGYLLNRISKSIAKDNDSQSTGSNNTADPGVRLQVPAAQDNKIPVVYGSAHLGGIVTEAVMSEGGTRMTFVLTICERTGTLLSTGQASTFKLLDVYFNDQRVVFESTGGEAGILVKYTEDREGNQDTSAAGLIRVWFYNGNSTSGRAPEGYTNTIPNANTVIPGWTTAHTMSDLVFAVVQLNYNRERGINRLPDIKFHINNSMTLPGDCMLDFMTSTRYGAGIPQSDIRVT